MPVTPLSIEKKDCVHSGIMAGKMLLVTCSAMAVVPLWGYVIIESLFLFDSVDAHSTPYGVVFVDLTEFVIAIEFSSIRIVSIHYVV